MDRVIEEKLRRDCKGLGGGGSNSINPLVLRIQVLGQFFSPSESGLY